MARPPKEGFGYFSVDVDFDEKVKALQIIYKNDGTAWFLKFCQTAYKKTSGEVDLRSPFDMVFAQECNITVDRHKEILALAIQVEFCYQVSEGVYTSNGIQKRIEQIIKERKFDKERKNINRKRTGTSPAGKPLVRPENPLSERKTTEQLPSNPDDPPPFSPEIIDVASKECKKAQALIERINKIRRLGIDKDNEKSNESQS